MIFCKKRLPRDFWPVVKLDWLMREMIQNEEAEKPFCKFQGACRV